MALPSDAAALRDAILQNLRDSAYIPLTSGEFNPTIEEEEKWILQFAEQSNSLLLIAVYDDIVVGNIDITGHSRIRLRHTGVIGMSIRKDWRNCGLSSVLMKEAIEWAHNSKTLELLWLQVYSDNDAGLALYRKFGFEMNGGQARFFKHENQEYHDNITMTLQL